MYILFIKAYKSPSMASVFLFPSNPNKLSLWCSHNLQWCICLLMEPPLHPNRVVLSLGAVSSSAIGVWFLCLNFFCPGFHISIWTYMRLGLCSTMIEMSFCSVEVRFGLIFVFLQWSGLSYMLHRKCLRHRCLGFPFF